MSRSVDETRRAFLLRLAKTAVFVPPAIASLDVPRLAGQGQGSNVSNSGGTKGQGQAEGQSTLGGLSPTSSTSSVQQIQVQGSDDPAPWNPGSSGAQPPWSRPPPTQTGG